MRRQTCIAEEMISAVNFAGNKIRFSNSSREDILTGISGRGYRYLRSDGYTVCPEGCADEKCRRLFGEFIELLGSSDRDGQIAMCNEYREKFSEILKVRKEKEKESVKVNASLGSFFALSVLILFL